MGDRDVTLAVRRILIKGPPLQENEDPNEFDERMQKAYDDFMKTDALSHACDAANAALPEGYYCQIVE